MKKICVFFSFLVLLLFLLFLDFSLKSQDEEDEYALLYAPRLLFEGPLPKVSVSLMESQEKVFFSTDGALKITVQHNGHRDIFIPEGGRFIATASNVKKGKILHRAVVGGLAYGDMEKREAFRKKWEKRGYEVNFFMIGAVFGLKGKVIDHRRYLATVGGFTRERKALVEAKKLQAKYGIRPRIYHDLVTFPHGKLSIISSSGEKLSESENMIALRLYNSERADITIEGVEHGSGYQWAGREERNYRGEIRVVLNAQGKLSVINIISLEEMLKGLVPSEIYSRASLEALKAQAVVARGEVLAKIGTVHLSEPYLFCATQHCQVYAGKNRETSATDRAVEETRGLVLASNGHIVDTVYSSNCGGHTEDNDAVWFNSPNRNLRGKPDSIGNVGVPQKITSKNIRAFLASKPKTFCAISSYNRAEKFRWKVTLSTEKITKLVNKKYPIGKIKKLKVLKRGSGGRVKALRIKGEKDSVVVYKELNIRQLFGNLNSALFVIDIKRDEKNMPRSFTFIGAGWGHGVGMCQTGAIGMAEQGYSFREILHHYYGGSEVIKIY